MSDPENGQRDPAHEPVDERTGAQWRELSIQMALANAGGSPGEVNNELEAAARSEPQSPVAPAYRLWIADNLAREKRYPEAIRAFDTAVDVAQSTRRLLRQVDPTACALLHKAQTAAIGGDPSTAITTYKDLAALPDRTADALFQAGLLAERVGDDEQAASLYGFVGSDRPTSETDDPAQLARRALQRLEAPTVTYTDNALGLADLLAEALEGHDVGQLDRLAGRTHFAVGPAGGHLAFAQPETLDQFHRDLLDSSVTAERKLAGCGGKLYLATRGWNGEWFRGDVLCVLTEAPKGWQWTGVAVTQSHDGWIERWRPAARQGNQPPTLPLLAPWPAGQSFKAGGLTEFVAQQAAIVAAGLIGGAILAAAFARNACGFGPRGFYYNQGPTHDEEDAFAIDFTRYERNVPYNNESSGTPVLAVRDGVVARVSAGTPSGSSSASNTVEIVHGDPADPTDDDRFRSRYLHLAGPFQVRVSEMMFVITGQRLGQMDDTGNSALDHLHFSVHDRNLSHPNVSYGRSVRPSPLDGSRLGDGDSGACVSSSNVERFPGLNFRPTVVSFGSVPLGSVQTRTLTMQNSAGQTISVSFPASPPGSVFQWAAFSGTLANREERSFELRFRPASNAIARATLTVTSSAPGSPHSIGLIGKGPGGFPPPDPEPSPAGTLDFRPDVVTFGSVPLGTVATRTLTIENQTGASVQLSFPASASGSVFQWSAFSGTLAHGTERSFELRFRPASNAIARATLTVTSTAPGTPHSIGLIGKGPGGF
jgi:murein DD-endopeptidase MepM/ murein hydrolase activator NlpD